MGFGGIGAWQLLILLLIVALVFGTKRLRNVGGDLGSAVRGFREGLGGNAETGVAQPKAEADRLEDGRSAESKRLDASSSAAP